MTAATEQGQDLDTAQVEYRVLGPLAAFTDGTRLGLGGRRQRMVLAVLLANANRIISQDALIDAVWEGAMPESGARSLHSYVSVLRKTLGGGIERVGDGYVINVEPERLDVLQFEQLVAEGRSLAQVQPARSAQLLRQALGLWTGTAFGELGHEPALLGEAARLAKERIASLELRFEADLMLGRHEEIIPELEALLGEEPYREHLAGMLMISLYRSRRQAEALRVYAGMRARLVEELGIDPGEELQDLELKILERDPDLAAPTIDLDTAGEVHGARGYEVHEAIGRTEFGERFRGFHGTMAREVSVLVIDSDMANERGFVRNFEADMQAVAQLEHPHLAPVLDFWRDPDNAYVITPFYRGGILETAIVDGPLSLTAALRIADQVAAALGSLHRQGRRHGAITAASVFLDEEHNAYLTDTGLAEARDAAGLEVADDVCQLGALVYQTLTGRPVEGAGPDRLAEDLPSELAHAISRALHPQPDLRYQRIEDFARALRQNAGLDVLVTTADVADIDRRNPYKGLRAFQESDAGDFHGRDALIQEMVDALTESRLVAVVGPSGSGKSSAVRAGFLPRLRSGGVPGSGEWLITDMFPGSHPFETLAAALLRIATTRPAGLYETLISDPRGLGIIVDQLLQPAGSELLLVIDQFEELFSLVSSPSDRQKFLDALIAASEQSRLRIVLTLRADFFDQPLQYPEFAEVFRANLVAVSPPTRDGLARAISQPALNAGVGLEPGLVTQIIDDVREQPGGLPLLQFALTDLFARRTGDVLTLDSYSESGSVGGALALRAEETYAGLSPQGKEAARQLFLRLVTVDELADDTRRRVRQSELHGLDIDREVMGQVLQQFGALRFLSFDRDAASRAPTVELAHEALLREWQRLKTWTDERREDLLIHRRIQITVQDWRDSGDDRSYLLRGARLEQALTWQERTDIAISEEEMSLIEASIETEKVELAEREALEARAARRRKAVIGVLAGGLVVAGVLGVVAFDRARNASTSAAMAAGRELAISGMAAIEEDPELGVLLSLESIATTDAVGVEPVPEAASALRTTLANMRVESRIPTGFSAVAYNSDGTRLVTDDADRSTLHLWDPNAPAEMTQWTGLAEDDLTSSQITGIEVDPEGDLVATTWAADPFGPEDVIAMTLHEAETLDPFRKLMGERGAYRDVSFGADGLIAATFEGDRRRGAYLWDRETGEVIDIIANVEGGQFIPNTPILVLGHSPILDSTGAQVSPGRLQAIDVITGVEEWVLPEVGLAPAAIAVSPDGSKVAISDFDLVEVWNLDTREREHAWSRIDVGTLTWSWDSTRLAISGNDADVTIYDEARQWEASARLTGHKSSVRGNVFHPDGERLASASNDGDVVIWNVTETGAVGHDAVSVGSDVGLIYLGPGLLVAGANPQAVTVDLATGSKTTLPITEPYGLIPNSRYTSVAGYIRDASSITGHLVDPRTGQITVNFPPCLLPRGVSFDSRLVVLDGVEACERGAWQPSQLRDMSNDEVLIDLGERWVERTVFSPEGWVGPAYVALTSDNNLDIYSLEDKTRVASYSWDDLGIAGFLVLSLSPDGKYLGVGTNGPNSIVVDMEALMSGAEKMDAVLFNVETNTTNSPQFRVTNDGIGATASFDPVYRVWDITTGEYLFEVRVNGLDDIGAVNFTWDGTQLAYEDVQGVIRFTPLDTREVVVRAKETVTRSLTDDECSRYLHTDGCGGR